jgi:MFS family permease
MKLGSWVVMLLTMIIIMEFIGLPTGLGTILNDFGVSVNPTTHELINADIENSNFFSKIFLTGSGVLALLLASGVGAVIIGLFSKSYDPSLIILPVITGTAALFISTFWSIIKYVQEIPTTEAWMVRLVATVFVGLAAGFIWSCVDYFAGR